MNQNFVYNPETDVWTCAHNHDHELVEATNGAICVECLTVISVDEMWAIYNAIWAAINERIEANRTLWQRYLEQFNMNHDIMEWQQELRK